MKKILNILAVLLISIKISNAQDIPTPNSYIVNNTLTVFEGTWMWTSGTDTVKIYLMKQKVFYAGLPYYADDIVGWHLYKRGNQVIESSYSYAGTPKSNGHSTILGGNEEVPNRLDCQLKDLSKWSKNYEATLTLNTATQLIWSSRTHSGMGAYTDPSQIPPAGLTLPTYMVFTKQ